jgi:curved DNA-binding protein CbpA
MTDFVDHYAVLGVRTNASAKDVKHAYRELCKVWHPDRNPDNVQAATQRFQQVGAAFSALSDEAQRRSLDAKLRAKGMFYNRASPVAPQQKPKPKPKPQSKPAEPYYQPPWASAAASSSSSSSSSSHGKERTPQAQAEHDRRKEEKKNKKKEKSSAKAAAVSELSDRAGFAGCRR